MSVQCRCASLLGVVHAGRSGATGWCCVYASWCVVRVELIGKMLIRTRWRVRALKLGRALVVFFGFVRG